MKRAFPVFLLSAALGGAVGVGLKSMRQDRPALSRISPGPGAVSFTQAPQGNPARAVAPVRVAAAPKNAVMPRPDLQELRAAPESERLRLLIRWLPEAGAAEIAALAGEWFAEKSPADSGNEVWQVLVQRWVELDAPAALAHARIISRKLVSQFGGNVTTPLHYAYRALGRHNPELAFAFLAGETGLALKFLIEQVQRGAGEEKTREWALSLPDRADLSYLRKEAPKAPPDMSDPAKAAATLTAQELKYQGSFLAGEWAKKDPTAALAWANGLESGKLRTEALTAIVSKLLEKDPAAALKVMESMPPTAARARLGADYVRALAKTDPAAAWKYLDANLKGGPRLQGIAALAAAKSVTDPAGALKMLRENGIGDLNRSSLMQTKVSSPMASSGGYYWGTDFVGEVLKVAAVNDPGGVMQLLAETGAIVGARDAPFGRDNPHSEGYLARSLFKEWAAKDPAAAARWTASQAPGESMRELAKSAAAPWFAADPAAVRAFAASLPEGAGKTDFIGTTASLMAGNDPVGALTWTAQAGGVEALGSVFQSVARSNPELAAAHFAALPAEVQAARMQELTDILGKRAPGAAVGFYQSLPPEQQASVKLYETTISFARQDPKAASEWVTTLPATMAKDTAISGLVDYLIKQSSDPDPEAAAHWAAASVDAEGRGRRLQRVGEAWFKRDPAGAAAAIKASTLPADVKQTLLNHASVK